MGACTSKKVANQVDTDAIVSKHEINHSAHEHLKSMLNNEDPMNASLSSEALNSTLKKMQRPSKEGEEAKVFDKDASNFESDGGRLHEPLWQLSLLLWFKFSTEILKKIFVFHYFSYIVCN